MSPQSPNRAVRMEQAQEAVGRIKVREKVHCVWGDSLGDLSTTRAKVFFSSKALISDQGPVVQSSIKLILG